MKLEAEGWREKDNKDLGKSLEPGCLALAKKEMVVSQCKHREPGGLC